MRIHKEGKQILLITAIAVLLGNIVSYFALYSLSWGKYLFWFLLFESVLLFLIILQFFRDPKRTTPHNDYHVIAPADGKVVVVEEVEAHEHLQGKHIQVSIFMSPFNVHCNRFPVGGEVTYTQYHAGKFLVAWHPKSSTENERNTVAVKNKIGKEVLFTQIAGALARRIVCYAKKGDVAVQGEQYGFIKFGSRVDVILPLDTEVQVKIGDTVRGGETVIALWKK